MILKPFENRGVGEAACVTTQPHCPCLHRKYAPIETSGLKRRGNVCQAQLQRVFDTIPTTLNNAYDERRTNETQTRKLLHIVVSAVRPLTLREMNIALSIDEGNVVESGSLNYLIP